MGSQFSFDESLKKIQVPVITLINNNHKFNFIIDTGSSTSAINSACLKDMNYQMLEETQVSFGVEGNPNVCEMCGVEFTNENGNRFVDVMTIIDLSTAFENIRQTDNVEIHGILGSTFFTAYSCVLDYGQKKIFIP